MGPGREGAINKFKLTSLLGGFRFYSSTSHREARITSNINFIKWLSFLQQYVTSRSANRQQHKGSNNLQNNYQGQTTENTDAPYPHPPPPCPHCFSPSTPFPSTQPILSFPHPHFPPANPPFLAPSPIQCLLGRCKPDFRSVPAL